MTPFGHNFELSIEAHDPSSSAKQFTMGLGFLCTWLLEKTIFDCRSIFCHLTIHWGPKVGLSQWKFLYHTGDEKIDFLAEMNDIFRLISEFKDF